MERLEFLVSEVCKLQFTGNNQCLVDLIEKLNDIIYFLEAKGPEADKALLHIQACCWMLYEGKHLRTEDQFFNTFHYIQNKVLRACQSLTGSKQKSREAA